LGEIVDARALWPLINALKDPDRVVRREVINALKALEIPSGIEAARLAQADLEAQEADEYQLLLADLCQLIDLERNNKTPAESSSNKARQIGEKLNRSGGFELMREMMQEVSRRRPYDYQLLNFWWDGIGDWRY
jgi:hypothetical protein